MKTKVFVDKAIKQDDRNIFEKYRGKVSSVPKAFVDLYEDYNPVDVEVSINGSMVKLIPYEELDEIQKEYSLDKECFVFATCNGEPVYEKNKKIYTCVFSKKGIIEEEISDSFEDYCDLLDT